MKKTLALTIVLTLLLTIEVFGTTIDFTDVEQKDWYYENLNDIVEKNIIVGYPDGTFKPNDNLKFEEFVKMVVVATEDKPIKAIQGQEWYQIFIDTAKENKYISEGLTKLIGQNIDRKTMSEIIYNVISSKEDFKEYTAEEITYLHTKFTDMTNSDTKTLTISGLGIICGYPDGTFKPGISLRRCETVATISRLINKNMRLPIEIDLTETKPTPTDTVDLSNLYDYPTLLGSTVKEENSYYDQYADDYKKIVTDDYIDFMGLMHNRDYTTISNNAEQYKNNLLYYLNGRKEYKGTEYFRLRSYDLKGETEKEVIDYVMSLDTYIGNFLDKWVQDTIDNKVKVQAKFYTNENLLHDADGLQAIRGILRIKYDNHSNPSNIKEELDLVQREKQKYGQRILNLDESCYNIYMDYEDIPNLEVGKWYEIEMDVVVSSQAYCQGLENKSKLNYEYIYPIAVREIK